MPVALVSNLLDNAEKQEIADALLMQPNGQVSLGAVKMPHLTDSTELKDRIGPNSWHFFNALALDSGFLSEPVDDWAKIPAFLKFQKFVLNMPITNDESERLVRRTVRYANIGPKGEAEFQAQL